MGDMKVTWSWKWPDVAAFAIVMGAGVYLVASGHLDVKGLFYALGTLFLKAPLKLDESQPPSP